MAPTPQKQADLSNPDAAIRAANEAREKAERELAAAQKKLAEMEASAGRVASRAVPRALPEQYKGTKKYRVRVPHYRRGVYYAAGDIITVTDEVPSKTWVAVEERQVTQIVETEPAPAGRAADQQV